MTTQCERCEWLCRACTALRVEELDEAIVTMRRLLGNIQ